MKFKKNAPDRRKRNILLKTTAAIAITFLILFISGFFIEGQGAWSPDYPKIELGSMIDQEELSENDYKIILLQTGLGKAATDKIVADYEAGAARENTLNGYQDDFFSSGSYKSRKIGVITFEDDNSNENGEIVKGFDFADLRNGDVLISMTTHSLGWRHGHAAIVTDASDGETLEAVLLGTDSMLQNIEKWQSYSNCIILRLKDNTDGVSEEIAEYAKDTMYDVPYGLFTGIPDKAPEIIRKTQCAHLIWYPYYHFGYDIDSDGSWLVTPKDIANSDLFEIVQVYGADPEELWP